LPANDIPAKKIKPAVASPTNAIRRGVITASLYLSVAATELPDSGVVDSILRDIASGGGNFDMLKAAL
jgi:hypothetical protein